MLDAIANSSSTYAHRSGLSIQPENRVRNNLKHVENVDLHRLKKSVVTFTTLGLLQNIRSRKSDSKPDKKTVNSTAGHDSDKSMQQQVKSVKKNKPSHESQHFYHRVAEHRNKKSSSKKTQKTKKIKQTESTLNTINNAPLPLASNATQLLPMQVFPIKNRAHNTGNRALKLAAASPPKVGESAKKTSQVSENRNKRAPQLKTELNWQTLQDYDYDYGYGYNYDHEAGSSWEQPEEKPGPQPSVRVVPSIAEKATTRHDLATVRSCPTPSAPSLLSTTAFPPLVRTIDDLVWDALGVEHKNKLTLIHVLMKSQNMSADDAAVLFRLMTEDIQKVLTTADNPERHWDALSDQSQRLIAAQYALKDQGPDIARSGAFALGMACFNQLIDSEASFKRIYADTLQINHLAQDTGLMRSLRVNALNGLLALFEREGLSRQGLDFDDCRNSFIFAQSTDSAEDNAWLVDSAAILDKYGNSPNPEQAFQSDSQTSLHALRQEYRKKVGVDYVFLLATDLLLNAFDFNGVALMNPSVRGLYFDQLIDLPELNKNPLFSALDKTQKIALINYVRMQVAESERFRIGSLKHAVDTMLMRLPEDTLHRGAHQHGDDAWFNLSVGLYFAESKGVRQVTDDWAETFWNDINGACNENATLHFWRKAHLDSLKGGAPDLKFVVKIANILCDVASTNPDKKSEKLVVFAKRMVDKYSIPEGVYGGKNSDDILASLMKYVQKNLGVGETQPSSRQGWKDWLDGPHKTFVRAGSGFNAEKKYGIKNTIVTIEKIDLPGSQTLLEELRAEEKSLARSLRLRRMKHGDIDPAYYPLMVLAQTQHNVTMLVDARGNPCNLEVKPIDDGSRVTTVLRSLNGKLFDNYWNGATHHPAGQMLAENVHDGRVYSALPGNGSASDLIIGRRRLDQHPTLANITQVLGSLKDFTSADPGAMFDQVFTVHPVYKNVDAAPREDFIEFCNSWLFIGIAKNALDRVGKWSIAYGNAIYLEYGTNRLMLMENSQSEKMPFIYDLARNGDRYPIKRGTLHEDLHLFTNQKDPRTEDQLDQGLIIALTTLINQQAGLPWSYRPTYAVPKEAPTVEDGLDQFGVAQWADKSLEAIVADIAPIHVRELGEVFTKGADKSLTVTAMRACLASLPHHALPDSSPLLHAFRVAGKVGGQLNHQMQSDNLNAIFDHLYSAGGLFAQLATEYQHQLQGGLWRFEYLDPDTAAKKFGPYEASHLVDHKTRTAYVSDAAQNDIYFLGPDGLQKLTRERQLALIAVEALTGTPNVRGEQACVDRGLVVELVNRCLPKSISQIAAATVKGTDEVQILELLNNLTLKRRCNFDENLLINKALKDAQQSWMK